MSGFFVNTTLLNVVEIRNDPNNILNGNNFPRFYIIFYIISNIGHRYFSALELSMAKQGINNTLKIPNVAVYGMGKIVNNLWCQNNILLLRLSVNNGDS